MQVRQGHSREADALSDLALHSKAHWGYPPEFVEACRAELTVTAAHCEAGLARVAVDGDRVVGFSLVEGAELTMLYVEPGHLGRGVGRLLLDDVVDRARARGVEALVIDADPHAEAFYVRMGAVRTGTVPSGSIAGRVLPQLRLRVTR